jgi:hypothetical protein
VVIGVPVRFRLALCDELLPRILLRPPDSLMRVPRLLSEEEPRELELLAELPELLLRPEPEELRLEEPWLLPEPELLPPVRCWAPPREDDDLLADFFLPRVEDVDDCLMISKFFKAQFVNGYWRTYLELRLLPEWLRLP